MLGAQVNYEAGTCEARVKLRYDTKIRYHQPGGGNVHKRKTCPHDNLVLLPCLKPL